MTSRRSLLVLALLALAACGGDGGTDPDNRPVSIVVSGPALGPTGGQTVGVGQNLQLGVTGRTATGTAVEVSGTPTWRSSATSIATVTSAGVVRGVSAGTATITASVNGMEGAVVVTVTQTLSNVVDIFTPGERTFSPTDVTIPAGGTVRFNIFGIPHNVIFDKTVPGVPADIPAVNGQIVSRVFNTRGTFPFECTLHPGMVGRVFVQ
jgi:plastocyanin